MTDRVTNGPHGSHNLRHGGGNNDVWFAWHGMMIECRLLSAGVEQSAGKRAAEYSSVGVFKSAATDCLQVGLGFHSSLDQVSSVLFRLSSLFAARCYASAGLAVVRHVCPSVCLSVTPVHSVEIFSPSCSHTILVFPHQRACQYSDAPPPNRGDECTWGRQKSRI